MSPLSLPEQIATIAICIFGTMLTRFLPFLIFSSKKPTPKTVQYLGKALPCAVFGLLVVYCLKHVSVFPALTEFRSSSQSQLPLPCTFGKNKCCSPLPQARSSICSYCSLFFSLSEKSQR